MSFQKSYAEPYECLKTQFKDWALMFCASILYYEETDPLMADLHRKAISVFDGNVPSFHIELFDKPTLVGVSRCVHASIVIGFISKKPEIGVLPARVHE